LSTFIMNINGAAFRAERSICKKQPRECFGSAARDLYRDRSKGVLRLKSHLPDAHCLLGYHAAPEEETKFKPLPRLARNRSRPHWLPLRPFLWADACGGTYEWPTRVE